MSKTIGSFQNAKLLHVVPEVIPDYLKHNDIATGLHGRREEVRIIPDLLTYTKKQPKIRFTLPNDATYDFHRAYLIFTVSFSSVGSTYVRCHNGIWNMFERVRVLGDTLEIENIEQYGKINNWLYFANREQDVDATLGPMMGVGTAISRNAWAAGREYVIGLPIGWTRDKVIPFDLIKNNIYLDLYVYQPEYFSGLLKTLPALGSHFCTWDVYTTNIDGSKVEFNIPHKSQSISSMFAIMMDTNSETNPLLNDRHMKWNHNNAQNYLIRLHGKYIPERAIECSTANIYQAYLNYLKMIGIWNFTGQYSDHISITPSDYATNKFMVCYDFETHPLEHNVMNLSVDTSTSHSNFLLQITLGSIPAAPQTLYLFIHYHRVWAMDHNGRIQVNTS